MEEGKIFSLCYSLGALVPQVTALEGSFKDQVSHRKSPKCFVLNNGLSWKLLASFIITKFRTLVLSQGFYHQTDVGKISVHVLLKSEDFVQKKTFE